jgi:tetratricopeptide (TPR) repeat protein/tRNA A-37 threonylcarbamoyl transferase component Bud32/TolB-like protein
VDPQVGPYRIVERLGAGGMGEVYLAEDTRLGRQVALKRLSDASLGDAEARSRILREAGAAATLNHPNVAAVYDVLDSGGRAYIVMEYVPGQSLAEQVHHNGPMPVDRVVQLGVQLCDALAEAHRHDIIHRDLKPANVRVTPAGRVKVLDFGLAKRPAAIAAVGGGRRAVVEESIAAAYGQVVGTPTYMAPEVLLGSPADSRSDIYSLGVTLFELAVGKPPFEGSNFMSIALAVLTEPPPAITTLLPGGLGDIVAKCMARDQAERYQSVVALRRDLMSLSAALSDSPTGPVHVPSSIRERLFGVGAAKASRRTMMWGIGAAGVLIGVATVMTADLFKGGFAGVIPGPPVVAVVALPTVSDSSAHANLGVGVAAELGGYLSNVARGATIVTSSSGAPIEVQAAGIVSAGRSSGATYVIPVLVQVQSGRVQMNAQLLRASTQAVIGSATERGRIGDTEFFDVQERLALRVAELLKRELAPGTIPAQPPQAPPARTVVSSVDDFAEYSAAIALLGRRFVAGNVDRAVTALEGVALRSPGFAAAHSGLSRAYLTKFRESANNASFIDKAIASARRAVDLDPADTRGLEALALAYQASGRIDEAEQALRSALSRQPRSDTLHRTLGDVLVRSERVDEGLERLRDAVRLRPDYPENQTTLGLALYARGRHEEALAPLRRATELLPDDPLAQQRLAVAYHQLGRLDDALAHYRESARLGGSASTYSNMATILYRQGKFDEALAGYEQSLKLRPDSQTTWRSKGDTLNRLGRADEATDAWRAAASLAEKLLQANPGNVQARGFLAVCRAKLGQDDVARSLAAQALREAPTNPDVIYRCAVVATLTGRLDEGRAFLDRALKAGFSASEAAVDDDLRALGPAAARAAK